MSPIDDLVRRLDAAGPTGWEDEYARTCVAVTHDQAHEIVVSGHACAEWFAFRFDAGPPGVPLPQVADAMRAILMGRDGTPLDAYAAVFSTRSIPVGAPPEALLAVLCNSAACALKRGTTWFATWLAARAGLAAIALGDPERAWLFLDGLTIGGRRHPHLDKLATFAPIRGNPLLERNPWVRGAICRLWPHLGVPVMPSLPYPSPADHAGPSADTTMAELTRIGADAMHALVQSFVGASVLPIVNEHADDPLVRELRARATVRESTPPEVARLPPWFESWARAVAHAGEPLLARLAGLLLYRQGTSDIGFAAALIVPAARSADLPVLSAGLKEPELVAMFQELSAAASVLPTAAADALVAVALPEHVDRDAALPILAPQVSLLERVNAAPGGVIAHVISVLRRILDDRARAHAAERPLVARLLSAVHQAAGRLDHGRQLTEEDVERAAGALAVPEMTTGLLELAVEADGLPSLERLLLTLALRCAVSGTEHEPHWRPALAKLASDAIGTRREFALFALRLRLLDEAIAACHPSFSRAELHFERANTRRGLHPADHHETKLALADLEMSIQLSRADGDPSRRAAATAAWVKTLVWSAAGGGGSIDFGAAETAIDQALALRIDAFDQALLHQARAHLVRSRAPSESLPAFEAALGLAPKDNPFWSELAAEIVVTLVRAGRPAEAVSRGLAFVSEVSSETRPVELGMLHLALGEAMFASGRLVEARRELEAGLAHVRGRDMLNETIARLNLAHVGLGTRDLELVEEHLGFLRDHRDELDALTVRDLCLVEAAAAAARGQRDAEKTHLERALSITEDDATQVRLRLELARADLVAGRSVDDLDALVALALGVKADTGLDQIMADLVCNHGDVGLSQTTRERIVEWAHERGHPSVAAATQFRGGRVDEGVATLHDALAGDLDAHERLACVHQLVTMLWEDRVEERRRLCAELEHLLDVIVDAPHVRLDLAAALRLDANGDPDVLWRARRHALRALEAVRDQRTLAFGHRTLGRIIIDLLRLAIPQSTASLAELGNWLSNRLAVPEGEAVELRSAAVEALLIPGAIVHPRALDVARTLIDLARRDDPDDRGCAALVERLRWIEMCVEAETLVAPSPLERKGPFDDLPSWLVGLVLNAGRMVSAEAVGSGVESLWMALHARPDAADQVLAALLPVQHVLTATARERFLAGVYNLVQSLAAPEAAWSGLRAAIEVIPAEHAHPMLARLEAAIARSSGHAPRAIRRPDPTGSVGETIGVGAIGSRQRARDCFERGVALMQGLLLDSHAPDAADRVSESRALLAEAVRVAREEAMTELFDFLVSHGNAWKTEPGTDLEEALRIYDSAARLDAIPEQFAKLWKVQADALRARGAPGDLRCAEKLLVRSLKVRRRGRLRAETLLSASQVALAHPDLDDAEREKRATELLMDAVQADRTFAEQLLDFLGRRLTAWQTHRPGDPTPGRLREELKSMYPARAAEIDAPVARASEREVDVMVRLLEHPAGRAFMKVRTRLMSAAERSADGFGFLERLEPTLRDSIEAQAQRDSLLGNADAAEAVLASLSEASDAAARPGILAARVVLLAHLVRLGRHTAQEVTDATTDAVAGLADVNDVLIRSLLQREIAVVWSPADHGDDPLRDFAAAVDLLRQCVALEGGEERAVDDTLGFLARALRYSPAGDLHTNLRETRRLYEICLRRASASGGPDTVANLIYNLSEVESQMGLGSRLDRLRWSSARVREALKLARSPEKAAQLEAALAWNLTQIGTLLDGAERKQHLEEALALFGEVDGTRLADAARRSVEGNRTVCEAALARLLHGRDAEIGVWRRRLEAPEANAPHAIATAKHNLANALMFGAGVTGEQLNEGLRLCREAAAVRTVEADARHHWETAFSAGQALLGPLRAGRFDLLPQSAGQARKEAEAWLRSAILAARVLGPGEEMASAAFALCELGLAAASIPELIGQTEEAWTVVREASAHLLLDKESREREAWTAFHVAAELAYRLGERALSVPTPGIKWVLEGHNAELVGRWMVRGHDPARRPLQARLSRPAAVSAGAWESWRSAVGTGEQRQVADALDRMRLVHPEFLSADAANEKMWDWLAARPGSVAVAVILVEPVSIAMLMQVDDGNRRTWVLGLALPPAPIPADRFGDLIQKGGGARDAIAEREAMAAWLHAGVAVPVERFLGNRPTALLWCPGPHLRLIAPALIWRRVPVATTTGLTLPDLDASPGRRRSTLVVMADPGGNAKPGLDLRGHGVRALEALSKAASTRGPIRVVGSVGDTFGRALLGDSNVVRDSPASARDVLAEAGEHEVIVLVAHGEVKTPEDAAVLCVDSSGVIDPLDVAKLGRTPDRFAGATVVLLSCHGGRVGDSLADPGGVAGALISAGARCVVAPLRPVEIDIAVQVGKAVLEGLAHGLEPWDALARMHVDSSGSSPALGRPFPSVAENQAARLLQVVDFVVWEG